MFAYSHHYFFLFYFSAMAGNIIPTIATTNAVIAGLIVMEGLKVLSGHLDKCKTVSKESKEIKPFFLQIYKSGCT